MAGEPESVGAAADPAAPPAPPKAAGKAGRWIRLAAIFGGLGVAAVALVLFVLRPMFPPPAAGAKPPAARHAERFGKVVALEPVVVNLAQSEGRRYLKVSVHVEVPDEERAVKEVELRKAQLLDLLVAALTTKTLAEVTAPEALQRLRTEIQERAGEALGREKIRRVFITEFVVQ